MAIPIPRTDVGLTKQKMLSWAAARFSILLFGDSNGYTDPYGRYECLLGGGAVSRLVSDDSIAFRSLQGLHDARKDWLFLHLSYDLKNVLGPRLSSRHSSRHGWPLMQAFVPECVCYILRGEPVLRIETWTGEPGQIGAEILAMQFDEVSTLPNITFQSKLSKDDYLEKIRTLKEHIRDGDCYEINFCNEGFAEGVSINPIHVFNRLNTASPAPFAAFYKDGVQTMMGASPERFLRKQGRVLRSQPIKGTARRGANSEDDSILIEALRHSNKERAENVMITDLVRSDLARSCEPGSVRVDELFGIYNYPQVHQMMSTISGRLRADVPFTEAISRAFPMGSMTGAPKHMVMQLIDRYEVSRRELFSGSVGYISPEGDFDLNVVIRSLFYNSDGQFLSYQSGGAITWRSDPAEEWDELRLKARTMERLFE